VSHPTVPIKLPKPLAPPVGRGPGPTQPNRRAAPEQSSRLDHGLSLTRPAPFPPSPPLIGRLEAAPVPSGFVALLARSADPCLPPSGSRAGFVERKGDRFLFTYSWIRVYLLLLCFNLWRLRDTVPQLSAKVSFSCWVGTGFP
jgi:hypothetical protein